MLLAIPVVYGMTICPTVALLLCLLIVGLLPWLLLFVFPLLLSQGDPLHAMEVIRETTRCLLYRFINK